MVAIDGVAVHEEKIVIFFIPRFVILLCVNVNACVKTVSLCIYEEQSALRTSPYLGKIEGMSLREVTTPLEILVVVNNFVMNQYKPSKVTQMNLF